MADGASHSLQGTHSLHPHSRSHPRGPTQRARSPSGGSKLSYNSRGASPNPSILSKSPRQSNKMYNQNQGHGHHGMMNGANNQRYGMQMNMAKNYGHQGQQQHHGHPHHQQQQDHNAHQGHVSNYAHHQHNHSGAGLTTNNLLNAASHYANTLNQNGGSTPGFNGSNNKAPNEHMAHLMQLHQQAREMMVPHPHARNASGNSRSILAVTSSNILKEAEKEDKRPGAELDASAMDQQAWNALDLGGQNLKLVSAALFKYGFLTKLYLNNNRLSVLPPMIGKLRELRELNISLNEIRELPPEIGMLSKLTELLMFDNNLETLPFELGMLYQLKTLGIEGNPLLDEELKGMIVENGTSGLVNYLRENSSAPEPPVDRPWIVLDETPLAEQDKLTILSFNVLCEKSATQSQHGYTSLAALAWERRKNLVLSEIRARNADIVALQECDASSYNEFFRAELAHNDYKGAFQQKMRAKTMLEKDARLVDGSAIFYKNKKFILLDKQVVDLRNTAINRPDMKGESDIFNRVMLRDDIALVLFLENRQTGARLIVSNVHIVWDPKLKDVKVVQTAILLDQISKFADKWATRPPLSDKEKMTYRFESEDVELDANGQPIEIPQQEVMPSQEYSTGSAIPLIMCGDYNSLPDSGVFELLSQGSLSQLHSDLENRKYGNFTRDGMTHPFALKSAYSPLGELKFTNYTPNFVGVLDYIFFSTQSMSVRGLLGDVDAGYLARTPGFPNWHFPSDHLCLFVELGVRVKKERKVVEADFGPSAGKKDRHR